ncbi:MAG: MBL fold metallo-hydrolase [Bacteriovorax sp.]|jgi:glyoxylase-like metal-dependent hydrolase (beta-lactamase superfamily II)/8-oxo-dGTP pyrophosphatase MutT (NUDIX family)
MKESVSAVFVTKNSVFFIKRQNYLPVFPGYYASPGGKVDKTDSDIIPMGDLWPKHVRPQILHALIREVKEELNYDLLEGIESGEVIGIDDIGVAVTPEFNPYRFKNYYFKITLTHELDFLIDPNEAEFGEWNSPDRLHSKYLQGQVLVVPPAITLLKTFSANPGHKTPIDMSLPYDPETEVPMIESISGVRQFLPLSNTFPPASRTNSFIIGDGGADAPKLLIDPSPKDEFELKKFLKSVSKIGFDSIFLTHHHPDHYEFAAEIARLFSVGIQLSADTFQRIKARSGESYFEGIPLIFRKEGDIVTKSLGHQVRVYEVPGHDEGQLALAPNNLNWFLAGDLIQTIGTVVIQAPEGDMKKYLETLERIIALNPKNCIPSHGIIVGGVHKLEETLKHRKEREVQVLNLAREGKGMSEMLESIYQGLDDSLIPFAQRTIEAHLKKLSEEKKI